MSLQRTTRLLVGVLLVVVVLSVSTAAVSGATAAELAQTTNESTSNATNANDSTANATLGNLTVWTASTDRFVDLSSVAAIRDGIQVGWLTRDRTVARDDTVVFALSAPDLTATVAAANAIDRETTFVQAVTDSDRYGFRVEQTVESTLAETRPKTLNLSATRLGGALQVTPDERNGTLYVALRTDRANFETEYRDVVSARTGDAYVVTVTAGNVSSKTKIEIVDPPISFDTDAGSVVRFGIERCGLVTGHAYPGADFPSCASGGVPISDTATIRPVESSPADTEPNTTATATPPSNATAAPTTTADGPGFGPAVAALALLVATLFARRRS